MNWSAYGKSAGMTGNPDDGLNLRVFVDSNILISALLSSKSVASQLLTLVLSDHHLVLCDYGLAEVAQVIGRKFPTAVPDAKTPREKWDHGQGKAEGVPKPSPDVRGPAQAVGRVSVT